MMKKILGILIIAGLIFGCSEQDKKLSNKEKPKFEAAISTVSDEATKVGSDILKDGGNAFDAAIATHFTLAVTYPQAGNLGGGGFTVYHDQYKESFCLDFREKAPGNASEDMYLDEDGNVIGGKSLYGALAAGVPGSIAGMWELHEKKGTKTWKELLQPAIDFAKNGFIISKEEAFNLNRYQADFKAYNKDSIPFIKKEWKAGDTLFQPVLAKTLQLIADSGMDVFYTGILGKKFVQDVQANDGIIEESDLVKYSAAFREPVKGNFRGYEIVSMPPSSSGGIALVQLMNGASKYPIRSWGQNSWKSIHLYTELMRRVYADRTTFLGDPEFYPVPTEKLVDPNYLHKRFIAIDINEKTNSEDIQAGKASRIESYETTHYSVLDKWGNAVSTTTTLNGNYGSKVWLPSVGFFLNNEMDDFSVKNGVANQFGLLGGKANSIEPDKRMLSSMTPTIVLKENKPVMIVGTPGGSTIITSVFQTVINYLEYDMTLQEAIDAPRMHHQWQPDVIVLEDGLFPQTTIDSLEAIGHKIVSPENGARLGKMNCIAIGDKGQSFAAADTSRWRGSAMVIKNE